MTESTKRLIAEKEAEIRKLQAEIDILKSLPPNGICLDLPLQQFEDLPTYIITALRKDKIYTAEDLINKSESELLKIRNIGTGKLQIIKKWLQFHNLKLLKKD